jgi:hypothetical protein
MIKHCVRCGFDTDSETIMQAHQLVHQARILRFEPLKTHMTMALTESRTQDESMNWEKALVMLEDFINEPFEAQQAANEGRDSSVEKESSQN